MKNALIFFKWCIKKKKVYQQFDVDIVPPAWNFIKNETPAQVFPCESFGVFDSAALLNTRLSKNCFPPNSREL